ncbi:MAG: hybrid sensor histidine kinase/response regulator [bacterium]|nr:hybrid sensor histidine kinase/response regulator [bacterium]
MEFEKEIYDGFVIEAREHLSSIEEDFLQLERQSDAPEKEVVDKVFRAIHTIKGGSGFLGLIQIGELSHIMETLLSMVRSGEMTPNSNLIDALLEGVDLLNSLLDDIENNDKINIATIVKRLNNMLTNEVSFEVNKELITQVTLSDSKGEETGFKLSEFKSKRINENGHFLYVLKFDLNEVAKKKGKTPVMIMRELAKLGEIIDGKVDVPLADISQKVEKAPLFYEVLFASALPPEILGKQIDLPGKSIDVLIEGKDSSIITESKTVIETEIETESETEIETESETEIETEIETESETEIETENEIEIETESETETKTKIETQAATEIETGKKKEKKKKTKKKAKSETKEPLKPPEPPTEPGTAAPVKKATPPETSLPKTTKTADTKSNTVRINVNILDKLMNLAGELVLVRNQQLIHVDRSDIVSRSMVQRLDMVTSDLQETIMHTRMQPVGTIFGKYPRVVRDLSKKLAKKIELEISGNEVELDKTILESLADPLTHIIRNSCDHGIESPAERKKKGKPEKGLITLKAYHEAGQINIEIKDDGKGIDPDIIKKSVISKGLRTEEEIAQMNEKQIISMVTLPGFSTAQKVSDLSGRGVGMDVVRSNVEKLNGRLDMESVLGKGSTISLKLPLTLAIIPSLIVMVENNRFAIPQVNLEELVRLYDNDMLTRIECASDKELFRLRDQLLPLIRLSEILKHPAPFTKETRAEITERYRTDRASLLEQQQDKEYTGSLSFAVLRVGSRRFGLIIDQVLGTEEIVVKPMHPLIKNLKCYSGATVMGDGKVALILDVEGLVRHTGILEDTTEEDARTGYDSETENEEDLQSLLFFKIGQQEQFALALPILKRVEHIPMGKIEMVGKREFITVDDVSTGVVRLDKHLKISPCTDGEEMFLILPKFMDKPFGILASELVDIKTRKVVLNTESYMEDGLLGTAIIDDQMTLFVDIFRLIELAEPNWFKKAKKNIEQNNERKILVVEDASFFQEVIRCYLRSEGFDVSVAENGEEALQMMAENNYSLVVSDLDMPVMDGWTLLRHIKENDNMKHVPVIALTALNADEIHNQALKIGFDGYETKLNRESLLGKIEGLLA